MSFRMRVSTASWAAAMPAVASRMVRPKPGPAGARRSTLNHETLHRFACCNGPLESYQKRAAQPQLRTTDCTDHTDTKLNSTLRVQQIRIQVPTECFVVIWPFFLISVIRAIRGCLVLLTDLKRRGLPRAKLYFSTSCGMLGGVARKTRQGA